MQGIGSNRLIQVYVGCTNNMFRKILCLFLQDGNSNGTLSKWLPYVALFTKGSLIVVILRQQLTVIVL